MIDGLEGIRRDPQPHRAAERVRDHRHVQQIRQKAPLGFDVGVAHFMTDLGRLAGQIAASRHYQPRMQPFAPCRIKRGPRKDQLGYFGFDQVRGPIKSGQNRVKPLAQFS